MAAGISRYDGIEIATTTVRDATGERQVRYLRRRAAPYPGPGRPLAVHRVAEGDRLDLVTHRYFGDPLAFWLVADANAALDPDELVGPQAVGSVLVIPAPGG
ncbi:LysM domain-containing protein [Streptomyces sp. NPDC041003]|uniref:LysM domain-containing protein n=1 Tax=Streptomyces sp. NPDC041003 TaxID=3155730 RepID=UPI0033D4AC24